MVFRLHVWGPAFGLSSIDAECLATITYLAWTLPTSEWELVATSPSGVPTQSLPSLQDSKSGTWVAGFTSITSHLGQVHPEWDLDRHIGIVQKADTTAYTTFLHANAAPLVALSLYVSSANWAATTRPAYSEFLPFPLTWTEPMSIRRRMCDAAEHLGLSDLNIDDERTPDQAQGSATSEATEGFLKIPERLRPRRRGVKAFLSPEQTALFRLEAVARETLGVLADLKGNVGLGDERFFFGSDRPTSLDCLAFGYLALMLVPEVPRPWLRDVVRRRYEALALFVDNIRDELFGGDVASSLPWQKLPAGNESWKVTRFARGVLKATVPEDWLMSQSSPRKPQNKGRRVLAALGTSAAVLSMVGSALLYRQLMPFGSTLYRWEIQRRRTFGTAGAFFGI
ncbi:hypothetical protein VP1G_09169 [Cytospora mali]|uniref:Metaxin-like protein n=1 Tax=Cytospora mali TaxID=578113 RepID=A0A194VDR4_CYTMA|nr:hypothetical protein VP1G_09169 [Valsa mali var. pyri (nom. inval.)]